MRHLLLIALVAVFGMAPLGGRMVGAQGGVDEAWQNVARPTAGAPLERLDELQSNLTTLGAESQAEDVQNIRNRLAEEETQTGFVVSFLEPLSHIPEILGAEQMAVYVRSGEFVLDNMGPYPFTVVPGGDGTVNTMTIEGDDQTAVYILNEGSAGILSSETGGVCTGYCVVTPPPGEANEPRIALQLLEGDWVILPAAAAELCVWCLFNQHLESGETTGILYVFPLLPEAETAEGFTWVENWESSPSLHATDRSRPAKMALETIDATTDEPLSNVRTWAYFNPAPNCRGN